MRRAAKLALVKKPLIINPKNPALRAKIVLRDT
jgi:hypothetical protein